MNKEACTLFFRSYAWHSAATGVLASC